MTGKKVISLDKINEIINSKAKEYEGNAEYAKAEAINDLKIDINDPDNIEDVSQNIQQTSGVISAQKIIDDEL